MKDKDKQGLPPNDHDEKFYLDDIMDVASATDCTGLMPTPPANEAEAESYTDLYPVPQVGNKVDNGLQRESGIGGDMVNHTRSKEKKNKSKQQ